MVRSVIIVRKISKKKWYALLVCVPHRYKEYVFVQGIKSIVPYNFLNFVGQNELIN